MKRFPACGSLVSLAAIFVGCSLGPEYSRSTLELPATYYESAPSGDSIANLPWWEFFGDTTLQTLIRHALAENKDLRIASCRVAEVRALLGAARSAQYPSVDLSGNATRFDSSEKVLAFEFQPRNDFGLFGDIFFELDVWGKLRRATQADQARLLSTEYAYRAVNISLVSAVAQSYFAILDLDNRLSISQHTVENRKNATALIRTRFKGGVIPEIDVNQAEIEEADALAKAASVERELRIVENALSVLLGRMPHKISRGKPLEAQQFLAELAVRYPAELIERRPDILAAEEAVRAATAEVGVAQAERLPSLSLTGFIGLESRDESGLFKGDARTWNIGGNLLGPLLDFGKRRHLAEAAQARAEQGYRTYEQTVLRAVQEVEDALISIRTYRAQHEALIMLSRAAANAARLSRARYNDGISQYLEVLDTERSLFDAELSASAALRSYLNSIVTLYKALGGGWSEQDTAKNYSPSYLN